MTRNLGHIPDKLGTIPDKVGTIPDNLGTIPDIIGTITDNIFFPWVIFRTNICIVQNMTKITATDEFYALSGTPSIVSMADIFLKIFIEKKTLAKMTKILGTD